MFNNVVSFLCKKHSFIITRLEFRKFHVILHIKIVNNYMH
jgi:hypothetical protein